MRFLLAVLILMTWLDFGSAACNDEDWWASMDRPGWSLCSSQTANKYIKGLWRNDPQGNNGLGLIEEAKCCPAVEQSYVDVGAQCLDQNSWGLTLDRNNVWAKCPSGYFLNGLYISANQYLHQIENAKCCRPNNHPDNYADCYEEDVGISFDKKGWSVCKRDGYYMNGFYRGGCDYIYCIEKFSCCKMKTVAVDGGWSDYGPWGNCSSSCGEGFQERVRTCTNPPPSQGGAQCSGSDKEFQKCNDGPCPVVNGGFTRWSAFGKCSKTCGKGWKTRTRTCTNPPPSGGGKCCEGKYSEKQICKMGHCPTGVIVFLIVLMTVEEAI